MSPRWLCLDVGGAFVGEAREGSVRALVPGMPQMTFPAAFLAVAERGQRHQYVFSLAGAPDWVREALA